MDRQKAQYSKSITYGHDYHAGLLGKQPAIIAGQGATSRQKCPAMDKDEYRSFGASLLWYPNIEMKAIFVLLNLVVSYDRSKPRAQLRRYGRLARSINQTVPG